MSALYLIRTVVIGAFVTLPVTEHTAVIFGGAIGFCWLGTVPLTSGLVRQIFGARYLSTLYGLVFFTHQVGSFFGGLGRWSHLRLLRFIRSNLVVNRRSGTPRRFDSLTDQ